MMHAMEGFRMRLQSLLLLATVFAAAPLVAKNPVPPDSAPATVQRGDAAELEVTTTQQPVALPTAQVKEDSTAESDGICYKIRAYIFKSDDDHAPQLKGSTTCGPRQPRAMGVVWPNARLVPAQ
jgi:hypothetical protein